MKIAKMRPGRYLFLLWTASILFLAGVAMPMITLSKFIYIRSSFSVLSGVYELMINGRIVLAILVGGFSVVLPVVKILFLFKVLHAIRKKDEKELEIGEEERTAAGRAAHVGKDAKDHYASTRRYLHLMHEYGRWAMLDVMVVAVLIVTVKLGAIATIQVHAGLYIFGASVLILMGVTHGVVSLAGEEES